MIFSYHCRQSGFLIAEPHDNLTACHKCTHRRTLATVTGPDHVTMYCQTHGITAMRTNADVAR